MIKVQNLIDQAVQQSSQARTSERDLKYFHVSDAGTCYRKRYLKRLGVEPTSEIAIGSLRKMAAGDAGHEKLQALLRRNGSLFAAEGEIKSEHLKGHFDAIVKDNNDKCLLEFKTIEKWAMAYIKKDGPKSEHLLQMFTYWRYLRQDYSHLAQATLSYVKREDFESMEFNYIWSPEIENKVQAEWEPLISFWESLNLPPCTCDQDYGGSGIKYCRYQDEGGESCCNESLLETLLTV